MKSFETLSLKDGSCADFGDPYGKINILGKYLYKRWISMEFVPDIHGALKIVNPNYFGDCLTFPQVPPAGAIYIFFYSAVTIAQHLKDLLAPHS